MRIWGYGGIIAKREIDQCNQSLRNRMEAMDEWLFNLKPSKFTECPVHFESPGMIIDGLSILSLKSYHMALQAERRDVGKLIAPIVPQKLGSDSSAIRLLARCLRSAAR